MDTSGNIRKLDPGEEPGHLEIPIDHEPDPKCKICYGRGFVRHVIENVVEIRPCHCVKKRRHQND